jgi:tripartite-type tricarboxylate transporter receptor subunit TctC
MKRAASRFFEEQCIVKLLHAAFAAALALFASIACAQEFPAKPVKVIIPYPPGGGVDTLGRPMADALTRLWGQPIIIENRGGGGTIIGAEAVLRAPADGYTLMMTSDTTITSNPYVYKKLPYDPIKDFAPITALVTLPQMVLVHPSVPANTLDELVALAKKKPGALNYGAYGAGSQPHLVFSTLEAIAGVQFTQIPYKGANQAQLAVISNEVQLTMGSGNSHEWLRAGKLKALAIARAERDTLRTPTVPTLREVGYPELDPQLWFGMFAPAGTPRAVVQKINAGIVTIFANAEFREKYATGKTYDMALSSPEAFAEYIRADLIYKGRMIKRAGIQPE